MLRCGAECNRGVIDGSNATSDGGREGKRRRACVVVPERVKTGLDTDSNNAAGALDTPVALIVFNRPRLTRAMFERVAAARPRTLFLIADGPRSDRAGEAQLCAEVRNIVSAVDWPCEVHRSFAEQNLGCRQRIVSGLDWLFEQVEEAIILEDDILPDTSFFRYCEEMLERYRDDHRVSMITGFNIGADEAKAAESYYFSALTHIWGWATWRRAWRHYDEHLTGWPEAKRSGALRRVFPASSARRYWTPILDGMYRGVGPNTWDYQWMLTNILRGSLSVTPSVNLIENVGFGADATHVTDSSGAPRTAVGRLEFPLQHPAEVVASRKLDAIDQRLSEWHRPALPVRAFRKVGRTLFG